MWAYLCSFHVLNTDCLITRRDFWLIMCLMKLQKEAVNDSVLQMALIHPRLRYLSMYEYYIDQIKRLEKKRRIEGCRSFTSEFSLVLLPQLLLIRIRDFISFPS